jgi:hypothetical protein
MITTSATSQIWKKKKYWLGHLEIRILFFNFSWSGDSL